MTGHVASGTWKVLGMSGQMIENVQALDVFEINVLDGLLVRRRRKNAVEVEFALESDN